MHQKNVKEQGRKLLALGDIAKELKIKKFVLRNWEREFSIDSVDEGNAKRLYSDKEVHLFAQIKKMLYEDGLAIEEVKQKLIESKSIVSSHAVPVEPESVIAKQGARRIAVLEESTTEYKEKLVLYEVKHQLLELQKLIGKPACQELEGGKLEREEH